MTATLELPVIAPVLRLVEDDEGPADPRATFLDGEGPAFHTIRKMVQEGASMQRILAYGRHHGSFDHRYLRHVLVKLRHPTVQLDAICPPPRATPVRTVTLHPTAIRVLDLLCDGVSSDELAEHLDDVPASSLRHHLRALPQRLGAANHTQAVAWALSGRVRTVEQGS
jgi:ATP/maltotriose-dependent transcriptional regulator MalT